LKEPEKDFLMSVISSTNDLLRLPRRAVRGVRRRIARERDQRFWLAIHNSKVEPVYRTITGQFPDRALTPAQERMIRDYSADMFGHPEYGAWLRVYAAWRGEFLEGWIPHTFQIMRIMPRIQGRYQHIGMYRSLQGRLFGPGYFPDLLCCVNGTWMSPYADDRVFTPGEVKKLLFADHEAVFVKYEFSQKSDGVQRLTRETFDAAAVAAEGDCVIQAPIRQEASLAAFMPDSVATLRIMTYRPPEGPARSRGAYMRFGRSGKDSHALKTQVRVAVYDDQGRLCDAGEAGSWHAVTAHPDTGLTFAGYRVPQFAAAVALCEKLHERVPLVPLVGWDVAITADGEIQLMEWNTHNPEIRFPEATIGPSFTDLGWEKLCR
jgi:hypothetical protein